MKNYLKYIIVGAIGILVAFIAVILINGSNKTKVEIRVAPADANITINGKTYKNGTYDLPVGEAKVHIDFGADFVAQDFSMDIPANSKEPVKLYTFLIQRDGKTTWYDTHESDAILMNTIGDYLAGEEAKRFNEAHPITEKLPIIYANYDQEFNYREYRIDGGKFEQCKSDFCLKITDTTGDNLEAAKKAIKDAGFNPADYEIIYEYTPIKTL